jgi:ferredoxin-NADP reductase
VPGGVFSGWAHAEARVGDPVDAMPPEGRFVLDPDPAAPPRTVLGIACGSGITPVLGIARSLLSREPGSRFVLLYGNRSGADIMFREAVEDLKDRHVARFSVLHVLSRERQELDALHGRLDAARIAALLPGLVAPGEVAEAFLCGPTGFAEGARTALEGLGLDPARIHVEHFAAGTPATARRPVPAAPDAPAVATLTVTAEGVTRTVPMAEGETVLEAGLRAGLDLPWSCRNGMCCTCRAQGGGGRGRDGRQLLPPALGDGGGLRPHLPEPPQVGPADGGLRRGLRAPEPVPGSRVSAAMEIMGLADLPRARGGGVRQGLHRQGRALERSRPAPGVPVGAPGPRGARMPRPSRHALRRDGARPRPCCASPCPRTASRSWRRCLPTRRPSATPGCGGAQRRAARAVRRGAGGANLLLNPNHPAGERARVVGVTEFRFDRRLWQAG